MGVDVVAAAAFTLLVILVSHMVSGDR